MAAVAGALAARGANEDDGWNVQGMAMAASSSSGKLRSTKLLREARASNERMDSREMLKSLIGPEDDAEVDQTYTFADTNFFKALVYGAILCNAVVLGLQVEFRGKDWEQVWFIFENFFCAVFVLEMVTKMICWQSRYFFDVWNLLDMCIALSAVVDTWILPYAIDSQVSLQILQILRLFRIGKLLRMRKEMVAIIEGILSSAQGMVWIGLLLTVVIYTFAIFCCMTIGSRPKGFYGELMDHEIQFGGLFRAMLTLFNVCLIDGWADVVWPQMIYDPVMVLPLLGFLMVTCFGLMNALIGVIVERTTAATQKMNDADEQAEKRRRMGMVERLLDLVDSLDKDGDGTISAKELAKAESIGGLDEVVDGLNLPPGFTARDLYSILDDDCSGELYGDEFVQGIYRLVYCNPFQCQCLTFLNMAKIRQDIKSIAEKQDQLQLDLAQVAKSIKAELEDVLERQLVRHFSTAVAAAAPPKGETGGCGGEEDKRPQRIHFSLDELGPTAKSQAQRVPPLKIPPPVSHSPQADLLSAAATAGKAPQHGAPGWGNAGSPISPSFYSQSSEATGEDSGSVTRALLYGSDDSEAMHTPSEEGLRTNGSSRRVRTWTSLLMSRDRARGTEFQAESSTDSNSKVRRSDPAVMTRGLMLSPGTPPVAPLEQRIGASFDESSGSKRKKKLVHKKAAANRAQAAAIVEEAMEEEQMSSQAQLEPPLPVSNQ